MLKIIKNFICKIFGLFCNNKKKYYEPIKTYKPELKEEVKPEEPTSKEIPLALSKENIEEVIKALDPMGTDTVKENKEKYTELKNEKEVVPDIPNPIDEPKEVIKEDKEILLQPKYTEETEEPISALISWDKNKEITKKEVKEKIELAIVNKDGISMYRIVLCWSMSENKFKGLDQNRYHFVVDQDCNILHGNFDISDNLDIEYNKRPRGTYAIPTRGLNDNTISIAMLGMKDYKINHNGKIITGTYPINRKQYDVFCILAYHLSNIYDINIDLESILTRSEIEPVLGKKQKSNTYDFRFLPFDLHFDHVNPDPTILGKKIRDDIFETRNF